MAATVADTRLSTAPTEELQSKIVKQLWRKPSEEIALGDYTSYFHFYQRTCEALYLGIYTEAQALVADSHNHILTIVQIVWDLIDGSHRCTRPILREKLLQHQVFNQPKHDKTEALNNSINLALRLWLTLNFQRNNFSPATATISWDDQSTVQELVACQFHGPRLKPLSGSREVRILNNDITAVNLSRLGRINIDWTDNLKDHLKFDRVSKRLLVYGLKTCLYDHKNSGVNIIPLAVIEETLLTLQLLFPEWDPETLKLLHKMSHIRVLIEENGHTRRLFLADFHFWRDRLSEICFEYDSPPSGWKQIWVDRRNSLQWYTFWLAVVILLLTVIFGTVSSVTACLQTVYAYESLQLAREAAKSSL